jgi:hypothetical protein
LTCENVKHVCDIRLRGDRCDEHPVPPTWQALREMRRKAERSRATGLKEVREAEAWLDTIVDDEKARRAFDLQVAADERKVMGT